ncbi:MAG TPA: MucR family transcriptional regulator [Caulobacteraceae bacterium]|nr:MucR family transcriptional regulator [Caulobacteraceae bacterium]
MSDSLELQKIIGQVAAAYFNNSHVSPAEIPTIINHIASSLAAVGMPQGAVQSDETAGAPAVSAEQPKLTPAQIRRSITRDALISFEDNKPYKTLRRHLAAKGMTPDDYREKWGLAKTYPMVAPAYSEARSQMAKALGLGARTGATTRERQAPAAEVPVTAETASGAPAQEAAAADVQVSSPQTKAKRGRSTSPRPRGRPASKSRTRQGA